ncbi:hypothetical protein HB364_26515 [Pseudoflavitalea sp. X16]|uniref:hypothetical protein n=1 Tax=Paraflavitalea devenefica TaxID=2716334 RepID=UPI0014246E11|nr:hypothetical protein [Paraflavitalea devenefica]NII28665.1 hypothetical protein [Paraflavitalea devenefica]
MKKITIFLLLVVGMALKINAQIEATTGKITMLRVHDVGTAFGPPNNQIDAEVIVKISSKPNNAFGFKLRRDNNELTHKAMYELIREAFLNNRDVKIEYQVVPGKTNFILFRVITVGPEGTM